MLTLSPSRAKKWIRCKKSYDWRYNKKLVRVRKEVRLSLGSVMSEVWAGYYEVPHRDSATMADSLAKVLENNKLAFLGNHPDKERNEDWDKIVRVSGALSERYPQWAAPKDEFTVVAVETSFTIPLTPNLNLLAIPDTVVLVDDSRMILEHKVRYRYRLGDFTIDYQSAGTCLASNCEGTIYNIAEYSKLKFHRDTIMRTPEELNYFKNIFIHIGEDILSITPDRVLYPEPMRRCACEYWDLCNAEIQGFDVEDLINDLYMVTTRGKPQVVEVEPEEQEGE